MTAGRWKHSRERWVKSDRAKNRAARRARANSARQSLMRWRSAARRKEIRSWLIKRGINPSTMRPLVSGAP